MSGCAVAARRIVGVLTLTCVVVLLNLSVVAYVRQSVRRGESAEHYLNLTNHSVDDTILMLYTSRCVAQGSTTGCANNVSFNDVSAAFLSDAKDGEPFFEFFADRQATFWTLSADQRTAEPLALDVVITHVNPNAASFKKHMQERRVPYEGQRFRDWSELRYGLRSLYRFAINNTAMRQYRSRVADDVDWLASHAIEASLPSGGAEGGTRLIRHIYLVVDEPDQVPAWVRTASHATGGGDGGIIRVVTHRELYTAEEQAAGALPTFSSTSIETTLHRIPGLSPYFWYFNNDMLIGRRVSPFDLFRPLSPYRQELHFAGLNRPHGGAAPAGGGARAGLWLEPVLVSEGTVEHRSSLIKDTFGMMTHYLAARRLRGPPVIARYAHTPLLVNRRLLQTAVDSEGAGFAREAARARRCHTRTQQSFSITNLYGVYSLAMRRAHFARLHADARRRVPPTLNAVRSDRPALQGDFGTNPSWEARGPLGEPLASAPAAKRELLLADMAHNHVTESYLRLLMIENYDKLALTVALAKRESRSGHRFLFSTINDDIADLRISHAVSSSTAAEAARATTTTTTTTTSSSLSPSLAFYSNASTRSVSCEEDATGDECAFFALFQMLFKAVSGDRDDPAPWEVTSGQ